MGAELDARTRCVRRDVLVPPHISSRSPVSELIQLAVIDERSFTELPSAYLAQAGTALFVFETTNHGRLLLSN